MVGARASSIWMGTALRAVILTSADKYRLHVTRRTTGVPTTTALGSRNSPASSLTQELRPSPTTMMLTAGIGSPPQRTEPTRTADWPEASSVAGLSEFRSTGTGVANTRVPSAATWPGPAASSSPTPRTSGAVGTAPGSCPPTFPACHNKATRHASSNNPDHRISTPFQERLKEVDPGLEALVFIASLNEWSEGHYLEPDEAFGTGWLEAVRAAR